MGGQSSKSDIHDDGQGGQSRNTEAIKAVFVAKVYILFILRSFVIVDIPCVNDYETDVDILLTSGCFKQNF